MSGKKIPPHVATAHETRRRDRHPFVQLRIDSHWREGEARQAGALQERIAPVHRDVVAAFGARGVKVALDLLGYAGGAPRAPLVPLATKERAQVARALQDAGLLQGAPE